MTATSNGTSATTAGAKSTAGATRSASPVAKRVESLRALAAHDSTGAQREMWAWIQELGSKRDAVTLAELFATGKPPRGLDGPTDGILVTTLLSPPVDVPVQLLTRVWMPWQGKIFDSGANTGINRMTSWSKLPAKLIWPFYRMRDAEGGCVAFSFISGVEMGNVEPAVEVLKIDYAPVASNPAFVIRRIRDELVELVPDTHLGRVLFRLPGDRLRNVGYFALRQPAAV